MQVRDILAMKGETVFSIAPDDLVADAVATMVAKDSGSLVVMQAQRMVGMLTFREVLAELSRRGGSLGEARVAELMLGEPVAGHPADTVEQLRQLMIDRQVRYLPVVEDGRLLGVLSFRDVARAVINQASFENRLLKSYIKNWPEDEVAQGASGRDG